MPPNSNNNSKIKSLIDEKVELLIKEGNNIPCDDSTLNYKDLINLPAWFNEEKFKRGQKFFHDHIFAMLFAKFCGLLTILISPTILKILQFTNMSSTSLSAYKRYMATIFHMTLWYDKDFKPDSDLWKSIKIVRNLHFSASRRASKNKLNRISQTDMVLTQFGFMGFILSKPEMVGIYNATEEELEGFLHLWRTVGYLLGIEDRFNLCSGTLEETRDYCNLLINKVFSPRLKNNMDENFYNMSFALLDGMSVFQPCLNYPVAIRYIHQLCDTTFEETNINPICKMTLTSKFLLYFTAFVLYTYRWTVFRIYHNVIQNVSLYFIIKYFPFLAYIKFGIKNSQLPPVINNSS